MEPITTHHGLTVTPENKGRLVYVEGFEPTYKVEIRYQNQLWKIDWVTRPDLSPEPNQGHGLNSLLGAVRFLDADFGDLRQRHSVREENWANTFVPQWQQVRSEYGTPSEQG